MKTQNNLTRQEARRPSSGETVMERPSVRPPLDVYENKDEVLVIADLPGVQTDNITIRLDKDELWLEARRLPEEGQAVMSEYESADFRFALRMPPGINGNDIQARMEAGVLNIRLPKAEEVRPRQIKVTSA